ncbi:MAG: UDP-N-acetylglucosamine--N-acetylmuramyl-(pentapeptide) pyrophosphoryl-undecaprenol N-acetylglucosamine transferase, partial [Christensenellaceae bacterium]
LKEHSLFYLGADDIAKELVLAKGVPYTVIRCPKLSRSLTLRNLAVPFALKRAVDEAKEALSRISPDLVFSKGGYVSLPVVLAASKLSVPILTHESDLSPGLTTRLIAKKCKAVLTAFPETAARWKHGVCTGNPVRGELFLGDREQARLTYGVPYRKPLLLVFGGGSGSKRINDALRRILPQLTKDMAVLHITGKGNLIRSELPDYIQKEYESDMASAYAAADFVVSRAGANTVFELLALRKRALLIPLERASRGDQAENASYFEERGLCHVLSEERLDELLSSIESLIADDRLPERLATLHAARSNEKIVNEIAKALER